MDFKGGVGSLMCRLCAASYQMPIHHLHEPIDVFSEWLDDCEAAANGQRPGGAGAAGDAHSAEAPRFNEEDDEDDDEVPEAVDFGGGRNSKKKRPAQEAASGGSKKPKAGDKTEGKQTYTDLGLDDSDSEDED